MVKVNKPGLSSQVMKDYDPEKVEVLEAQTPLGTIYIGALEERLFFIKWADEWKSEQTQNKKNDVGDAKGFFFKSLALTDKNWVFTPSSIQKETLKQLKAYEKGKLKSFDLDLCFEYWGTPFQKKSWEVLASIPYGETMTYKEQAQHLGRPKAFRAVANANGKNPFPVVCPCHRVVASGGGLGGYTGGLVRKEKLLFIEGKAMTQR